VKKGARLAVSVGTNFYLRKKYGVGHGARNLAGIGIAPHPEYLNRRRIQGCYQDSDNVGRFFWMLSILNMRALNKMQRRHSESSSGLLHSEGFIDSRDEVEDFVLSECQKLPRS